MEQIARRSVTDAVTDSLRAEIATGAWPLGQRIPSESALISSLGVSRTAVREAVRGLVHAGLLQTRQGDGTFVVATDPTEVALRRRLAAAKHSDMTEVRRGLDVVAARLAAARRTGPQLQRLRAALDARAAAGSAGSEAEFVAADVAFHLDVAGAASNEILTELYASLSRALTETLRGDHCMSRYRADAPDWHEALYRAIEAQDPDAAESAALALVNSTP